MPDFIYWANRVREGDRLSQKEKEEKLCFTFAEFRQILTDWSKEVSDRAQVDKKAV